LDALLISLWDALPVGSDHGNGTPNKKTALISAAFAAAASKPDLLPLDFSLGGDERPVYITPIRGVSTKGRKISVREGLCGGLRGLELRANHAVAIEPISGP
jgi:hypothetical protein